MTATAASPTPRPKPASAGAAGHTVAIVPTDYDNRRDVDLLVVRDGGSAGAL